MFPPKETGSASYVTNLHNVSKIFSFPAPSSILERPGNAIGQRLHQIADRATLAGSDRHLGRHARLQGDVFELGHLLIGNAQAGVGRWSERVGSENLVKYPLVLITVCIVCQAQITFTS